MKTNPNQNPLLPKIALMIEMRGIKKVTKKLAEQAAEKTKQKQN